MPDSAWAVQVEGVTKSYGPVQAVAGVSFSVARGEVFALLGPNGAGKTTTVEMLEGFRKPDSGRIEVLGVDPGRRGTQRWMRERTGVVLQELSVEPYLSVRETLQRSAGYFPHPKSVDDVLATVGLEEKADAKVKSLSGGQQRRLDLGLGIIGDPELLFLDEPTTGFDPSARRGAWEVIERLVAGGATVILTTHYMDEAEALADRVAVMAGGKVVATGSPSSIDGRDVGEVTVRFELPEGCVVDDLPSRVSSEGRLGTDGFVEVRTNDELALLSELSSWALGRGLEHLRGLTVARLTLEDVYIRLTSGHADQPEPERVRP